MSCKPEESPAQIEAERQLLWSVTANARRATLEECRQLCQFAADAYAKGAGSAYSDDARKVGKAQAEWLRDEIANLMTK